MYNPLDFVTQQDLIELGLTLDEIAEAYQPSTGEVTHARGAEGTGKTLYIAHRYREGFDKGLVDIYGGGAFGNITLKGKYSQGYETLKSDDLRQLLWDVTHKPLKNKWIIIDEIDSEFPARAFTDNEQTEIALRLWHTHKVGNTVLTTSHMGKSTDLIIHLASHFFIYPQIPNFLTNTLDYEVVNTLDQNIQTGWQCKDIIKTMLIYSRKELTENTEEEQNKIRPSIKRKQKNSGRLLNEPTGELDLAAELSYLD